MAKVTQSSQAMVFKAFGIFGIGGVWRRPHVPFVERSRRLRLGVKRNTVHVFISHDS
jgi:hypothetical protein